MTIKHKHNCTFVIKRANAFNLKQYMTKLQTNTITLTPDSQQQCYGRSMAIYVEKHFCDCNIHRLGVREVAFYHFHWRTASMKPRLQAFDFWKLKSTMCEIGALIDIPFLYLSYNNTVLHKHWKCTRYTVHLLFFMMRVRSRTVRVQFV